MKTTSGRAVICLGNPLAGDDGAGCAVYELLSADDLSADLIDGATPGLGLLHVISRYKTVVIVDAADFGGSPGEVRLLRLDGAESFARAPLSLHGVNFAHVLALARELGALPDEMLLVAVQPKSIVPGEEMSKEVTAGIEAARKFVLQALCECPPLF